MFAPCAAVAHAHANTSSQDARVAHARARRAIYIATLYVTPRGSPCIVVISVFQFAGGWLRALARKVVCKVACNVVLRRKVHARKPARKAIVYYRVIIC